jgi:hypothetical protein
MRCLKTLEHFPADASSSLARWRTVLVCLLLLGLGSTFRRSASAEEVGNPPIPSSEQVQRWIAGLSSPSLAEREASERALLEAGPEVLRLLPRAETLRGEARFRAERIRGELEDRMVLRALEPTRFALVGRHQVGPAIELLSQFTSNPIRISDPKLADRPIQINLVGATFWESLDQILDQAELSIDDYSSQGEIVLRAGRGQRRAFAAYTGPFRVAAQRVSSMLDYRKPTLNALEITLQLAWEPRLQPIALQLPLDLIEAKDSRGVRVPPSQIGGVSEALLGKEATQTELRVSLMRPDRSTERLTELRGVVRAVMPLANHRFEFAKLSGEPVEQTMAQVRLRLESARMHDELLDVQLTIEFLHPDLALESHRQWIFDQPAFLVASDGRSIDNVGFEITRQKSDQVGIGLLFDIREDLASYRLVCELPTGVARLELPFQLRDLPLP